MILLMLTLLACTGSDASRGDGPAGWGAVFWKEGQAVRIGEGTVTVGRGGVKSVVEADGNGVCGGRKLTGTPPLSRLSVVPKGEAPALPPTSQVLSTAVSSAAGRLNEAMPAPDRFAPYVDDPTKLYGMTMGTVAKTRRELAPPVLLASALRDDIAVVAVLDRDGTETLSSLLLETWTERVNLLPVADYDGDGARELAAYGPKDLALLAFDESAPDPTLKVVHRWHCEDADGGPAAR